MTPVARGLVRSSRALAWLLAAASRQPAVAQQQAGAPSPVPLSVQVAVSADTILFPAREALPIVVRPSRPARVVATVSVADDPAAVVWRSDTVASGPLSWDLQGPGASRVGSGRYAIRVSAHDSEGGTASAVLFVVVTALPADTVAPPPPPEMLPETLLVGQTTPWAIPIAFAPIVLPSYLGRRSLNYGRRADRAALVVAATVGIAGYVAFTRGRHLERSSENVRLNAEARALHVRRLAEIREANAAARASAAVRVYLDRSAP